MSEPAVKLSPLAATATASLDAALARLRENATAFARSTVEERIALLRRLQGGYRSVAEEQVREGCRVKGLEFSSSVAAEEWLAGPVVTLRNIRLLIETLTRLARGEPLFNPDRVRTRADGRVIVDVFPASVLDRLLFSGFTAEVWMQEGVRAEEVLERAAPHYRTPPERREGKICLVLGAGNVASIPPMDVLYKMFVEGKVCILKMNPVNAHVGPFIERAFADAVSRGLLAVVYGGADVGAYLVEHPEVDEIHITGSDKTHDLLVWGPAGPEREARKQRGEPRLKKEVTSELGNISPVIVVPGPYSVGELAFQGDSIAAAVTNNASFNCNAAKLLVSARGWQGRERLRSAIAASLARTPVRKAYYPGAAERWNQLVDSHAHVERIGDAGPGALPWAIVSDVDPEKRDDQAFHLEPWCSVLSETAVGSPDPVAFLDAAVKFVNQRVWGTLSATLIVHPKSLADPKVKDAVERAIGELRYGVVVVNHWPALGYAFCTTPWGGHPSATLADIQSGRGWVHNTFMLEGIEKAVVRGPLVAKPTPPWFARHRTAHKLGERMVQMEAAPSAWKLPALIWTALRG